MESIIGSVTGSLDLFGDWLNFWTSLGDQIVSSLGLNDVPTLSSAIDGSSATE